jgi:type IV pilus assembly protein PilY1
VVDCNDTDRDINPDACDIKGDGIDQDCSGADRTRGKPCPGSSDDGGDSGGKELICDDGEDNDGDGLADCDDKDCRKYKYCR